MEFKIDSAANYVARYERLMARAGASNDTPGDLFHGDPDAVLLFEGARGNQKGARYELQAELSSGGVREMRDSITPESGFSARHTTNFQPADDALEIRECFAMHTGAAVCAESVTEWSVRVNKSKGTLTILECSTRLHN